MEKADKTENLLSSTFALYDKLRVTAKLGLVKASCLITIYRQKHQNYSIFTHNFFRLTPTKSAITNAIAALPICPYMMYPDPNRRE